MQTNILLDTSKPFDEQKVRLLDQVLEAIHSGNPQKVDRADCRSTRRTAY